MDYGERFQEETASALNKFRGDWVQQVIKKYQGNPGKPIVHLSDLGDTVMPGLGPGARDLIRGPFESCQMRNGPAVARLKFQNIFHFVQGVSSRPAKLRTWRTFSNATGFDIDLLEPYVVSLAISGGRFMRVVRNPILPFNLATASGAKLIGYRLDSNYRNAAFTNKDRILHHDYRKSVTDVGGGIPITETRSRGSGFTSDLYIRTNVGYLVSKLLSVAGCDNTREQRLANSPAPLWLFMCGEKIIVGFLASVWDAEGSANKRDVKLRQAIALSGMNPSLHIPRWPDYLLCSELDSESKETVLSHPPLILVSVALLLVTLGVVSHIEPDRVSETRNGTSAYWLLRIMRNSSITRFHEKIRLPSGTKEEEIERNVNAMRWNWKKYDFDYRKDS